MSALLGVVSRRAFAWFATLHDAGIDITDSAHIKVKKEADEFADEPSLEEAADVYISLLGACHHRGWSVTDLALAVHDKMEVNERRSWVKTEDGTYQHV